MQFPMPPGLPDTPDRAFAALARRPGAFWLDSGDRETPHGRFHHLGCAPATWLRVSERDPFPELRAFLRGVSPGDPAPLPAARVVCAIAYDCGRHLEALPDPGPRTVDDELVAAAYDACVTWDLATGRAWMTATSAAAADELAHALAGPPIDTLVGPATREPPRPGATPGAYAAQVSAVRELIAAGDVYQVNLSHRFEARLRPGVSASALYRRLRARHPAPYGAFFDAGTVAWVSNSPEAFLSVDLGPETRRVATWPLKGTRPRHVPAAELLADPKDRAEHVMIVDLERNDFGRFAVPGTVRVPVLLEVVSHSTVHHLESRVECVPRDGVDLVGVLCATFPGGSITGTPKIRAMEIISDFERARRGLYCGALGAILHGGDRSVWSIPIRTAAVRGEALELSVGGGIVADSDPMGEYEETLVKARAFLDVLADLG